MLNLQCGGLVRLRFTTLAAVAAIAFPISATAQIDIVAGSSNPAFRTCIATPRGPGWLNEAPSTCAKEELQRQDAKLNADYRASMAWVGERGDLLRQSQRQWLKVRDAKCKAAEANQIDGPDFHICMMEETTARVTDLDAFSARAR